MKKAHDSAVGEDIERSLPPELLLLLEAFRREMDARFRAVYLYVGLALFGGGTVGGVLAHVVAPQQPAGALHALASLFST